MPRRLKFLHSIVLLAVLVQFFAPVAAFRVVAAATSDPLYMASICAEHVSPDAPADTTHHNFCVACAAACGGAFAITTPPPIFITLQRQYQRLTWLEAASPAPVLRTGSNAQARAPPTLS
jgi:hypothetical protein